MADSNDRARLTETGRFVIDSKYLKDQADEAVHRFFAPLSGVFASAFGSDAVVATSEKPAGGARLKVGRYKAGVGGRKRLRKKVVGK